MTKTACIREMSGYRLGLRLILSVLLLIALCTGDTLAGPTVTLKEQATVEGTVTLADIAKIEGAKETKIGEVTIGHSPLAGRSRTVSAGYIRMRIARGDFEEYTLEGAERVKLVATGALQSQSRTDRRASQQSEGEAEKPPPLVIERSQRVQVRLINRGVVIDAAGRAMGDAAVDAPVVVRISSTGKRIQGTATATGRVVVSLGGE